jgi:hypothetical protein
MSAVARLPRLPRAQDQSKSDLAADPRGFVDVKWPLGNSLRQCRTFGQLHYGKPLALGFLQAMDGGNVLVAQGRKQLGFPIEPGHSFRVAGECFRQNLDGYPDFDNWRRQTPKMRATVSRKSFDFNSGIP